MSQSDLVSIFQSFCKVQTILELEQSIVNFFIGFVLAGELIADVDGPLEIASLDIFGLFNQKIFYRG